MENLTFKSLSLREQQEAEQLAQQLMRDVPDTVEPPRFSGALSASTLPYMRPDRLVAAFVYGSEAKWWGDLVFKDGQELRQIGTWPSSPVSSREAALHHVKRLLSQTKAMIKVPSLIL
jgi:hypothetical protein